MSNLNDARKAKEKAIKLFSKKKEVAGIGISEINKKYAIIINLYHPIKFCLPEEIDGFPIIVRVVGEVKKQ